MATQPNLTLREVSTPFNIKTLNYVQSAPGGNNLPVLQGQVSDPILFRIYNNFALAAGIAPAINLSLTIYDGAGAGSHTCALLPVSQSWVHVYEYGYGENSTTTPDRFTSYLGVDTAIGGNAPCGGDVYYPNVGCNGSTFEPQIRAYNNGAGMGYIEFLTYVAVPDQAGIQNQTYTFAIDVYYEWFS